jgi:hypothetical protein
MMLQICKREGKLLILPDLFNPFKNTKTIWQDLAIIKWLFQKLQGQILGSLIASICCCGSILFIRNILNLNAAAASCQSKHFADSAD